MSEDYKFLLVEGSDDKRLFKFLRNELAVKNGEWNRLLIHCVEELENTGAIKGGNRDVVEQLCIDIAKFPSFHNFAGFVDRDFRGFEIDSELKDTIGGHFVSGRLVWSRGHSIENYYFDLSLLRRPLRTFSVTEYFDHALELFDLQLISTIQLACAASLAGRECDNRLELIKSSVDWSIIDLNDDIAKIDVEKWRHNLVKRNKVNTEFAERLILSFSKWLSRVKGTHFDVVRWMCHGHIGMAFIWAIYGGCVHEVCRRGGVQHSERHVQRVLMAKESVRFNACADEWVAKILGREHLYPDELFRLLSLPNPQVV